MASIDPTLIGLGGVVIGGAITAGASYILAVRKERADRQDRDNERRRSARLACRLLRDDLVILFRHVEYSLFQNRDPNRELAGRYLTHWEVLRGDFAASTDSDLWLAVSYCYQHIRVLYHNAPPLEGQQVPDELGLRDAENLKITRDLIGKALPKMGEYTGDWPTDRQGAQPATRESEEQCGR